ncbi:MAG: hypothetical protein KC516_03400 [Nanoarchaeota archaeon]|nr:hypothetical protein [Nanoarchaeota archaeon]
MKNKKAQEEMVGFVLIVIIVAVLIFVFLSVSIKKSNNSLESYEIESFLQSLSHYTTDCAVGYYPSFREISELVKDCMDQDSCLDDRSACEVLNESLDSLISGSWPVGDKWPNKGYKFNLTSEDGEEILSFSEGNFTSNSRGAVESFENFDIVFDVYF